jgi:multidrug transporter EmrE-like cation transporter
MELSTNVTWSIVLIASILLDTLASVYLKVASDRLDGSGFFLASVAGVVAFAPSIILLGYALKIGPSYLATVGLWFVGAYVANAVVGVIAFDDPFTARAAAGIVVACLAVFLLTP